MKNVKKLLSLLMALTMIMALTVSASAAESHTITIKNPTAGTKYEAYKIFDLSYNEKQTAFSYTIATDSPWLNTVQNYFDLANTVDEYVQIASPKSNFDAAAFAAALAEALDTDVATDATADATATADGSPVTLTVEDLGYYFVTSSLGSLCNLTNTTPSASIYDKNDEPTIEKELKDGSSDRSVQVGDKVTYTITGEVPSTTGYKTYTYEISDKMNKGLKYNNDASITVNGEKLDVGKYKIEDIEGGFKITVYVMQLQDKIGEKIVVEYSATVTADAVETDAGKNTAVLTYSNDPADESKTDKDDNNIITVYSAQIVIEKYAAVENQPENHDTKLAGATFVLKNSEGKYYQKDEETGNVTWVDDIASATKVVTDNNGAGDFKGLENGTYKLVETEAPAGYNLLNEEKEIIVEVSADNTTVSVDVPNSTGTELPETGGIGTTIFTVVGGVLMVGAAVLFITKKRSEV